MFVSDLIQEEGRPPVLAHARYEMDQPSAARLWLFTKRSDAEGFSKKLPMNEAPKFRSRISELPESSIEPAVHIRGALAQSFISCITEFSNHPVDFGLIGVNQVCFIWNPVPKAPTEAVICWYMVDTEFHVAIVHSQTQAMDVVDTFDWAAETEKERLVKQIATWEMPVSTEEARIVHGPAARFLGGTALVAETRARAKRRAN